MNINPRQPLTNIIDGEPSGYMESDHDFVLDNIDVCVAFLENATIEYTVHSSCAGIQPPEVFTTEEEARARAAKIRSEDHYLGGKRSAQVFRRMSSVEELT